MRCLPVLILLSASAPAAAESMRCEGPGQSYVATLDREARTLILEGRGQPRSYQIQDIDGGRVSGSTIADGPTFRAFSEGRRRLELYHHGKLMKTDPCR